MLLFSTGNNTEASAAALSQLLANRLRDDLILHPAWELVEEFTPGSGLVNWVVMKNLASVSGLSQDYFLVIGRTISTGLTQYFICESYNTGTKTCQYYPPYYAGTSFNYDSLGRCPATFVLGTAAVAFSGNQPFARQWAPGGATTKWWLIVADDGFTMAWNGPVNTFVQVASYIPLATLQSELPIVMTQLTSGGSGPDGGVIRNPALVDVVGWNPNGLSVYSGGSPFQIYTPLVGIGYGFPLQNDKLNDNKRLMGEVGIVIYPANQSFIPTQGWFLGKHKARIRASSELLPASVWGDAFVMDGTLWVPYLPGASTDGRLWDTGVAA
jgi:hypothetical protein